MRLEAKRVKRRRGMGMGMGSRNEVSEEGRRLEVKRMRREREEIRSEESEEARI